MSMNAKDLSDFRRARMKEMLLSIFGVISGKPRTLLSWEDIRSKLKLRGGVSRGIVEVPIDKVVGSVGRYKDFDNAFLPARNNLQERWVRINRAFSESITLPPVKLYKLGESYFVLDGNHRISVARQQGITYIDAEVIEVNSRIPLTLQDLNSDHLEILGEYANFLERTRLDYLRPQQNVRFSIGGGYDQLLEHIAVHRYFMGQAQKREIGDDEAVTDWYDHVYTPILTAIQKAEVLESFPDRTEADLYLWMVEHEYYLEQAAGHDISADQVVADMMEHMQKDQDRAAETPTVLAQTQALATHLLIGNH
jgi:hypothetical protein